MGDPCVSGRGTYRNTMGDVPFASSVRRSRGSLIGRSDDVRALRALIGAHRLVTLLGPGGVGKTALAAEAAHELEPEFDRVVVVELVDAGVPGDVLRRLSRAVLDQSSAPPDTLVAAFDAVPTFLVIDNCEHVVAEVAAELSSLLENTTTLQILTTSRRPLAISDEATFTVSPLPTPEPLGSATDLLAVPAVQLFLERVRQAVPSFESNDRNNHAIASICAAADGVPLVLELAAALVRTRPLDEIVEAMTDRPSGLASKRRDIPEHQRTLAASFEWSRRFLEPVDIRLLDRLSVFVGGFSSTAVEAVDSAASREGLDRLVDHSLVVFDSDTNRYRLLEVVRLDALNRLSEPDRVIAEQRHYDWCLRLVELIDAGRLEPDPENTFSDYERDLPNLQVAAGRALDAGDNDRFLALIGPVAVWWVHYCPPHDPDIWAMAVEGDGVSLAWRANVTAALAFYWSHRGSHDLALKLARTAVELHGEAGDHAGCALALIGVGNALVALKDPPAARLAFEEALEVAIANDAVYPQLLTRVVLARLDPNDPGTRVHLSQALLLAQRGFGAIEAVTNTELAMLALRDGDIGLAKRLSDEGLRRARSHGFTEVLATALCGRGEVALVDGRHDDASRMFSEARALGRASSHVGLVERAEKGLAAVAKPESRPPTVGDLSEPLSVRELAVARLLRGDLTQREIADELYIAASTVKTHTKAIYRKLGVSKRSHAVTRAIELGLFD